MNEDKYDDKELIYPYQFIQNKVPLEFRLDFMNEMRDDDIVLTMMPPVQWSQKTMGYLWKVYDRVISKKEVY